MMKIYTIIGGLNGAGKSSLSGVLRTQLNDMGKIIDPDEITRSVGGDKYRAGKIAIAMINDFFNKGLSFTQETTLSGRLIIKNIQRAVQNGYTIRLFYVGIDNIEDNIERIKNRVKKGGHDIPADDVIRRYEKRFADLNGVLPYCREAIFYDNNNGFIQVAEYRNGEVLPVGEYSPKWLREFMDYRASKYGLL